MKSNFLFAFLSITVALSATAQDKPAGPVKVFLLCGQSNMEGKAKVSLMDYQARQEATKSIFTHLRTDDGKGWKERDDVFIKFLDRKGKLTVGFGSPQRVGPELQFGHVIGDHFDEPVLIIKTAWGGKSLYRDFRPPSSGFPDEAVLKELVAKAQKKKPETTVEDIKSSFGHFYRLMIEDVKSTMANIGEFVPGSKEGELAGIVWFQGWNDMINPTYTAEYGDHMANFIRDVRKDLDAPRTPFVIGQLGVGGADPAKPNEKRDIFKANQAKPAEMDEFKGNVAVVKTDQYWDTTADGVFQKGWKQNFEEWEKVGSDYPFHYLGSAKTMLGIGGGFAEAILKLQD
ncbi:MAG: sialate O-acetylesterase [Verrucomicrobiales bacterium]|nr:sialate O-acetylesterase [Verrucomicrobiales bacterium]